MKWEKLGLVYGPDGSSSWAKHSALQPTPVALSDRIRVFCGFRDDDGVSRAGYVDVAKDDPTTVLGVSEDPVLDVGDFGTFDQHGVVPCAVVDTEDELRMYYAGYLRGAKVRFQAFCGLAISRDCGASFSRYSQVPILDRTPAEALFRAIHSVLRENGVWRIWYGGGSEFVSGKSKTLPVYNIRYMESEDGIHFPDFGDVAVDISPGEHRVGRPYVINQAGKYRMFFGKGSEARAYQLAYAESDDGYSWIRKDDELGLSFSETEWDSEMMAYPAVISSSGHTYMFYNGNNYGREGFGCAKLISWEG
ncbi:hypothetical protein SAMN05421666_0710 [Roseovarius nanhaiticus]|uniref:Glycosyl hydrolases family 43 n=1 Tax=Roseovarius nanhaiticus TaxID=573024 RepID=A0A1N7F335_9RHOB|nr:hypothetical protein [Roseovarius nanhaiticus]SEK62594.1 hypothetical protein SAMN05216208_1425 [Roseovarius nanhaiticus]SIR94706.1 hypothetical protein SAMN05421666_0710 [Roseovarius nanhaiticus]